MHETIKIVNGYAITRLKGSRGYYEVVTDRGNGWRKFNVFRTIKEATLFCESLKPLTSL